MKNPDVPCTCGSVCRNSGRRAWRKAGHSSAVCLETGEVEAMALGGTSCAGTAVAFLRQLRARAAHILAQIGPDAKSAVPALVARLNDQDEGVRKASARARL